MLSCFSNIVTTLVNFPYPMRLSSANSMIRLMFELPILNKYIKHTDPYTKHGTLQRSCTAQYVGLLPYFVTPNHPVFFLTNYFTPPFHFDFTLLLFQGQGHAHTIDMRQSYQFITKHK